MACSTWTRFHTVSPTHTHTHTQAPTCFAHVPSLLIQQCRFFFFLLLHSSPDAVVVHQHSFESPEQRKPVQLSDLIIGEVDGIKLVQSGSEVLQHRDLITCTNMRTAFKGNIEQDKGSFDKAKERKQSRFTCFMVLYSVYV